jgi:hypothetical protein
LSRPGGDDRVDDGEVSDLHLEQRPVSTATWVIIASALVLRYVLGKFKEPAGMDDRRSRLRRCIVGIAHRQLYGQSRRQLPHQPRRLDRPAPDRRVV